ncbi:hypothetical protein V8G54_011867 [Vigna mungo]|uniref:Uncharacterized protein n=1 Tax=Vigna mungo TaxID=3915 RepID=A0AAQ3NSR0_VIGMU
MHSYYCKLITSFFVQLWACNPKELHHFNPDSLPAQRRTSPIHSRPKEELRRFRMVNQCNTPWPRVDDQSTQHPWLHHFLNSDSHHDATRSILTTTAEYSNSQTSEPNIIFPNQNPKFLNRNPNPNQGNPDLQEDKKNNNPN